MIHQKAAAAWLLMLYGKGAATQQGHSVRSSAVDPSAGEIDVGQKMPAGGPAQRSNEAHLGLPKSSPVVATLAEAGQ